MRPIKHGMTGTHIHNIWNEMKKRCLGKYCKSYEDYGGRGIKICEEWLDKDNGFQNFYQWAIENGYKEGLSIDRIDVDGNYEPNNCRWITFSEQQNNKRNTVYITIENETKTLKEWSEISGVQKDTIKHRLKIGITGRDLLLPPKPMRFDVVFYNNKEYSPNEFCKVFNIPSTSFRRMYYERGKSIEEILENYKNNY